MERQDILREVVTVLGDLSGHASSGITEATRPFEDLDLDSTSVLELLILVEDSTGIVIDPEDLTMGDFVSVGSLTSYLEDQGRHAATGGGQVAG